VAAISAIPDIGAIASLCFLLPTEGFVIYFIAWLLFGRTVLTATADGLALQRAVGRYVRARRFEAPLVDGVGVVDTEENGSRVRISYRGEHVNLLSGLSAADAQAIASSVDALLHPRSWWDETRPQKRRAVSTTRVPKPSSRRTNIVRLGVIAMCLAIGALASILGTKEDAKPRAVPSAVPQTGAMPQARDYPNPTTYAIAATSWMLDHGPSELVTQPRCDEGATWTHWSCTAIARTNWIAQNAGRPSPYRCDAAPSGGISCRLDTK
jgi:hypothetical protein